MALVDVAEGDQHVKAHNDERHAINDLGAILLGSENPPSNPTDGRLWLQTSPGGSVVPQFSDHFNSGSAASFSSHSGDTYDPTYAYRGKSGCRLTKSSAAAALTVGTTKLTQGNAWIACEFVFRIVNVPSTKAVILCEALTALASGTKDQYDLWMGIDGSLWINFSDSNNLVIDTACEIGVWHKLEFVVDYSTYTARTRYDGRRVADITEIPPQGPTTAQSWYCGSQDTTSGLTSIMDVGDVQLVTSPTDPGFINAGHPVLRAWNSAKSTWI